MDNLEIFDKDGKALHIGDVVGSFLKKESKERDIMMEDLYLCFDETQKEVDIYHDVDSDNRLRYLDSVK